MHVAVRNARQRKKLHILSTTKLFRLQVQAEAARHAVNQVTKIAMPHAQPSLVFRPSLFRHVSVLVGCGAAALAWCL